MAVRELIRVYCGAIRPQLGAVLESSNAVAFACLPCFGTLLQTMSSTEDSNMHLDILCAA